MLELWKLLKYRRYWCFWKSLTCHRGPSVILRERVHCSVLCMRLIVLGLVYPRKKADQKELCRASRMRRSNTLKIKCKNVKISRRSKFTFFYIFSEAKVYRRSCWKRMASIINKVEDSSLLRRSWLLPMFMVQEEKYFTFRQFHEENRKWAYAKSKEDSQKRNAKHMPLSFLRSCHVLELTYRKAAAGDGFFYF